MATKKTAKKSELAQAGEHLSAAAGEVGAAVTHKIEAMGDAVSAGMAKVKKNVMAQRDEGKRKISSVVRMAEAQFKKAEAEFKKMGERARKSVAQAEKKLEAIKRTSTKKLAALEANAQRKAKALKKAIDNETAALKKPKPIAPIKAAAEKAPAKKIAAKKATAKK